MDVINKLYSSVHSTVSQLSSVLPGNPVTREFEVTAHIASAGRGLLWKVYKGYKKSTKQEAAIFVFEKRMLDTWSKYDRELLLKVLRKGVMQLTKLRHPQILTVQHPLEESRDSLAFATEPVFASLANILKRFENTPKPVPEAINNYKLYDVEIKYGILQIGEGLAFLHNDVKLLHKNITPESIVMNTQGAWKIFGFDFCVLNENIGDQPCWPFSEYEPGLKSLETQPSLEYTAPECIFSKKHSTSSDIYSFGMLIYVLYSSKHTPILGNNIDYHDYKQMYYQNVELNQALIEIPEDLRQYIKLMLNETPDLRPDAHQFIKISFFDDLGVRTLNYLDSLFQWDNLQKSKFYKGLPDIIKRLPHRVNLNRVVPCLIKEFINPPMIPFVLPNILLIAENCTKEEYCEHILPELKPIMKLQEPIQILLIFMQKLELLLKLTPPSEIKTDILPMLYRAMETDAQQIQELCLQVLPNFATLIDYPSMKNAVLPRIKRLCTQTNLLSVRVNCLLCIGKLLEHLDKWLVLDEVLPFLPQIPSREPAVLMGILGVYKLSLTHKKLGITKEILATKALPFLIPLSIENGLTLNQFNSIMALIKEMINQVESEHRTKLEQLNSIRKEQKTLEAQLEDTSLSFQSLQKEISRSQHQNLNDIDDIFSNLGLDSYIKDSPIHLNKNELTENQINGRSLTIEDKQRIVREKELAKQLNEQKMITPIQTTQARITTSPKDLTTSLLEKNLNQLNQTSFKPFQNNSFHSNKTSNQLVSPTSMISSINNLPSSNLSSPINNFATSMNTNSTWSSTLTSPSSNWERSPSLSNNWMNNNASLSPMKPLQPVINNSNWSKNNNTSKQLTESDIMDFLK